MTKKELENIIRDYWADKDRAAIETKEDLEDISELCLELSTALDDE